MTKKLAWWQPEMGELEQQAVVEVVKSNYINDGALADEFAQAIAGRLEVPYGVAVTSGTMAIFASLAALGVGSGDEVLVPDVTFIATANSVSLTGATPVLVDIDPRTMCVSPAALARATTSRTRAVVPVHVTGRGAEMDTITEFAKKHNLFVVEDAAEALTSRWRGRFLGTWGHTGCFSFSPNKTITTGQGGVVVTADEKIHRRLRELKDQGRPVRGTGGDDEHVSLGYNLKFTNLQAAIGLAQLTRLESRVTRMREIYKRYRDNLEGVPGIRVLPFDIEQGEVPQWVDVEADDRDDLDRCLAEAGADCRRFWHPIHTQAPYRQSDELFPESTRMCARALWLPSAFTLTDDDIDFVCAEIRSFSDARYSASIQATRR